jgi:translation initiation factor IF-2
MSDSVPSGAETTAAETTSAPGTTPVTAPGKFSNNRGSGLARGKRSSTPAPAASAPAAEYKPTAVSILAAPTEYKNPFAPPAPVVEPEKTAPVETPVPTPVPAPAPVAQAIQVAEVPTVPSIAASESLPSPVESTPAEPLAVEPKPELKILPPETPQHVEQNWESQSFPNVAGHAGNEPSRPMEPQSGSQRPQREDRRGDRPYYRSERGRRDDRPYQPRDPRDEVTPPAQDVGTEQSQDKSASAPVETKKSGGFFSWVKSLFASSTPEAPKTETQPETSGQRDGNPEGPYRRRRHRGGRNRNFQGDQRGPRDGQQGGGQPSGDQRGYGGDQRGYRGDQRNYGGEQRGYRGEQRGYEGDNRSQGNRRPRHHGGGGYRGPGRQEGGPPPTGS